MAQETNITMYLRQASYRHKLNPRAISDLISLQELYLVALVYIGRKHRCVGMLYTRLTYGFCVQLDHFKHPMQIYHYGKFDGLKLNC